MSLRSRADRRSGKGDILQFSRHRRSGDASPLTPPQHRPHRRTGKTFGPAYARYPYSRTTDRGARRRTSAGASPHPARVSRTSAGPAHDRARGSRTSASASLHRARPSRTSATRPTHCAGTRRTSARWPRGPTRRRRTFAAVGVARFQRETASENGISYGLLNRTRAAADHAGGRRRVVVAGFGDEEAAPWASTTFPNATTAPATG
jgi:hypothetical protein